MRVIQESIIEKAKDFISKHKGKLAAAAGLAALAGAGYYAYNHFNNSTDNVGSKTPTNTGKMPAEDNKHDKNNGPTLEQRKALIRKIRQEAKERWNLAEKSWKETGKLPAGVDMNRTTIKLNTNVKNITNTHNAPSANTQHGFESRDINDNDDF